MKELVQPGEELLERWKTLSVCSETMRIDLGPTMAQVGVGPSPLEIPLVTPARAPSTGAALSDRRPFSLKGLPSLDVRGIEPGMPTEFQIQRTLGEGGMGIVRLARQASLFRDVAIKTLRKTPTSRGPTSRAAANDLLREAWIAGLLEHPNIIPIHALGVDEEGDPMIVMKMVEGISWAEALAQPDKLPSAFRADDDRLEAHLRILMQVCQAVHFAHSKGIIHRDLKPDNVMLGHFGEVYLLDWGIAVALDDDGTGRLPLARDCTEVAGTPGYLAPEMAAGSGTLFDARTDIYLLGAILHQLITGRLRHDESSVMASLLAAYQSVPFAYGDDVPNELAEICNKATARERDERFESAEAFRIALGICLRHRDSRRLTEEALSRRESLERLLAEFFAADGAAQEGSEAAPSSAIYETFAQARFAFEQALRIWDGNRAAAKGLEQTLETMVRLELHVGDEKAAAMLIADMVSAPAELLEGLEELRARLSSAGEELDALRRMHRDNDLRLASRARAKLTLAMGFFLGLLPLLNSILVRQGIIELSFKNFFIQYAFVISGMGLLVLWMRRQVIKNRANFRFIKGLFLALVGGLLARVLCYMVGLDVAASTAIEAGSYTASALSMAILLDRRVFPAAVAFGLGALAMAAWPTWFLEFDAASNAAALWLTALAWWVRADDEKNGLA